MSKVEIIAEAGVNHNGSLKLALQLVDSAANAGADIIKFQTFRAENVATAIARKADYQKKTTSKQENQLQMLQRLELSPEAYRVIADRCREQGVAFLSTPFDFGSIELLYDLNMPFWKIPSGEITNLPYLRRIGKTGKQVLLSTGMSTLDEVGAALDILRASGAGEITLLHCTTEYPAPFDEVNLRAMQTLRDTFGLPVGYSDHTAGFEVAIAAIAMGAIVIEKHITLDRNMEGPDHKASLEPHELAEMVKSIRNVEKALGDGIKRPSLSEEKNINIVRKSIVAKCDISQGSLLTENNITTKRPGTGISPMQWDAVIGSVAKRDFKEAELIVL